MKKSPVESEEEESVKLELGRHILIIYIGMAMFLIGLFVGITLAIWDENPLPDIWLIVNVWMMFIGLFIGGFTFLEAIKKEESAKQEDEQTARIESRFFLIGEIMWVIMFIGVFCFLIPPFWDINFHLFILTQLIAIFILLFSFVLDTLMSPGFTVPGSYQNKLKLVAIGWGGSYIIGCVAFELSFIWPAYTDLFFIIFAISLISSVPLLFYFIDNY